MSRRELLTTVVVTVTVLLFGGLLSYACNSPVTLEDASKNPNYSRYVGSHYRSTQPLVIYGITMERYYAPVLDHYTVTTPPGFGGREVLSEKALGIGTTFRVLRVLRCTDCYLDFAERVEAVVEITSSDQFKDAPVKVKIELLEGPEQAVTKFSP